MTEAIAKRPSGLDLQFERKAAGLTQDQVAVGLGVTRQRIAAIEGARFPSPKATEQYLATLASGGIDAGNVDVEVGPGSSGRSRRAAGSVGGRQ